MRNPFKFARPKGPGFGIAKDAYLSILCSRATLPPIAALAAPKPEGGAVEGFGVPLSGAQDKARLAEPMARGEYAIASRDQKTVLRLRVFPVDERGVGFDPEAVVRSALGARLSPEAQNRIRGTWWLGQLSFESHDPDVYPALDFLLDVAIRLAEITDGIVSDPIARRYLLPADLQAARAAAGERPVSVEAHVGAGLRPGAANTQGMTKFALPELEITGLADGEEDLAARYLLSAAQGVLEGHPMESGSTLAAGRDRFEVREGGLDRARWEGIPVLELLPPTGRTAGELLRAWDAAGHGL